MLLNLRRVAAVSLLSMFFHMSLWKEEEAQTTGGSTSSTAASTTTASTTEAAPTAPTIDSFFISSLRLTCSPEEAPADGPRWGYNIRQSIQRVTSPNNMKYTYSCSYRCGLDDRDAYRGVPRKCYCDKLCDYFGDCCFDFNALCRKSVNPQGSSMSANETCIAHDKTVYHGYAVLNTCPKKWKESSVRQKCQHEDEDDLLNYLPVFDSDSHVTYRNIFCAWCNGAINTTYWKLKFVCSAEFNTTGFNLSSITNLLHQNCLVIKHPARVQLKYLKRCIPRFQDCFKVSQKKNESYCQKECLRYAFPLCCNTTWRFRNPQCALCNGFKLNELKTECVLRTMNSLNSLMILFDFSSTSKYTIEVIERAQMTPQIYEQVTRYCASDEVYDPYSAKCRKVVSVPPQIATGAINKTELNPNCTFVRLNRSDYEQLTNGTVYIKPHHKIYGNTSYTVDDGELLLCVNFSRNATVIAKERTFREIKTTPTSLRLLTTIGCVISMASLVLLLITYTLVRGLRNLPGKIIINLAFSLLLYQSVFLSAVKTSNQGQCLIVAVLLHYFALCSFTWMNVMAYDVHRVFTASDRVEANQHGGYNKRLIMYCLYAWGAPAFVVSICVIIDQVVKEGSVGYGRGETECFISEPLAKVFSFVLPVALLMIFNVFALVHIVENIVKTRKKTQQVTNQRRGKGIALICVKMASVMGVTWILGIAANVGTLAFLWYPYVVLNSLQGLFIFLSFAASGRALELYRNKLPMLKCLKERSEKNNTPSSTAKRRGLPQDALCETGV